MNSRRPVLGPPLDSLGASGHFGRGVWRFGGSGNSLGSSAESPVALASRMLQPGAVEEDDAAALVADQAGVPELVGDDGDSASARAQHLCDQVVRERKLVFVRAVERLQQPARKAGLKLVQSIAGGGLLHLPEQGFFVSKDQVPNALALGDSGLKVRGRDDCGGGRDLDRRAGERMPRPQPGEGTDGTFAPHESTFYDLPIVHDGNKRHHAIKREVDLSDRSLLLLQNRAFCKVTGAQMRSEQGKIARLKCGQQPIFAFLEHANSAAMDLAGTPEIATKFHARS
jgi:hypothetical protein